MDLQRDPPTEAECMELSTLSPWPARSTPPADLSTAISTAQRSGCGMPFSVKINNTTAIDHRSDGMHVSDEPAETGAVTRTPGSRVDAHAKLPEDFVMARRWSKTKALPWRPMQ